MLKHNLSRILVARRTTTSRSLGVVRLLLDPARHALGMYVFSETDTPHTHMYTVIKNDVHVLKIHIMMLCAVDH